jgi:NADPH:quinone reductase-like Zn-dependent oxidoreductase
VLRVEDVPAPEPGPGEVRVRVAVSGVNPTDWKARAKGPLPGGFQIPNQDGAGVVDAVGEGVHPGRAGERVWVYFAAWQRPWGTAAQYTVLPAEQAVPLPGDAGDDLGASLGIPALTAHRCLLADGAVEGRTVLVAGGAGADVAGAELEVRRLMVPNLTLRFVLVYTIPRDALARAVSEVGDALRAGALTTLPLHRFPLERTAEAHDAVEGGAVGKVVIDVP